MALAMFLVGTNAGRADQPEPPTAAKGLAGYNDQLLIDGLIGYLTLVAVQSSDATMTEAALRAFLDGLSDEDYDAARWHPLHFKPMIDTATDSQCLACHADILERLPLTQSPAGVPAATSLAWYQTLDTYAGDQRTFHQRHITSEFSQRVMRLSCGFCHQGHDPRDGSPTNPEDPGTPFNLRKTVDVSQTCLRCHGAYPWEIMGTGPWPEARTDIEDEETPNGCLTCHGDFVRTVRHQVSYLNAEAIEEAAQEGSDVCYGCHGGRAWYRISYPYPRHPWPDMDEEIPDWAADRPTQSDPRFRIEKSD
jgi:hypothetical protein